MMDLRGLMGAAAMFVAGCAATVSSPTRGDVPLEARDAVDATEIASVTDALEARDAVDASDAEFTRMDADPACPPSPPRPGRRADVHPDAPRSPRRAVKLTAVRTPLPPLTEMDALLAQQLGPRLRQLTADPIGFAPRLDRLRFIDETGAPRFDACLHLGEDGPVYRAGTTEFVACFSQSSATECDDEDLAEQLEAALRALRVAERG